MADERDSTEASKQSEGDRLDIEAYRNLHKAEYGFNPPDLTIENARAYLDEYQKQEDLQKQEQLKKDQFQKDELDKKQRLKKDQLQKQEREKQDRIKTDQLRKQQLRKDEREKQERIKADQLKKQRLFEASLPQPTPQQIAQATRTREAKALEKFTEAHRSLAKAALLRQLTPETSKARDAIGSALDLVKNLPGKVNAIWPKEAKDHVKNALTLLDRDTQPETREPRGTNRFTKADYDGSRIPIITDHVADARELCEQGVGHLQHEQFKKAARDTAFTIFGQRHESSRTGIPLDRPLSLKRDSDPVRDNLTRALAHLDQAAASNDLPLNADQARQHIELALANRENPLGNDASPWSKASITHAKQAQTILAELHLDDRHITEQIREASQLCDVAAAKLDRQGTERAEKDQKKEFRVFRDARDARETDRDRGRSKDQGRE